MLIDGATGSGKTYLAVRILREYLSRGKHVVGNVKLTAEARFPGEYHFRALDSITDPVNDLKEPWWLVEIARIRGFETGLAMEEAAERGDSMQGGQVLLVLDECRLLYDCHETRQFPKCVKRFCALHRHYDVSVLIVTQDWGSVDKSWRTCATGVCNCLRIAMVPGPGQIVRFIAPRAMITQYRPLVSGEPSERLKGYWEWHYPRKSVTRLYRSVDIETEWHASTGQMVVSAATILGLCVGAIYLLVPRDGKAVESEKPPARPVASTATVTPAPPDEGRGPELELIAFEETADGAVWYYADPRTACGIRVSRKPLDGSSRAGSEAGRIPGTPGGQEMPHFEAGAYNARGGDPFAH